MEVSFIINLPINPLYFRCNFLFEGWGGKESGVVPPEKAGDIRVVKMSNYLKQIKKNQPPNPKTMSLT